MGGITCRNCGCNLTHVARGRGSHPGCSEILGVVVGYVLRAPIDLAFMSPVIQHADISDTPVYQVQEMKFVPSATDGPRFPRPPLRHRVPETNSTSTTSQLATLLWAYHRRAGPHGEELGDTLVPPTRPYGLPRPLWTKPSTDGAQCTQLVCLRR
jgi:hypothetical protein